ncbi:MAG: hypothetical protein WCJ11_09975 [Methylococcaceae bacterium]
MMEQKISVDTHYTRSIHLEKDAQSSAISYIPTSRALQTLEKIAATFNDFDMPRSWSLIGPYGSGKSAFALFLSQLFSAKQNAINVLAQADRSLAVKFTNSKMGYCTVLLTGSPESLSKRLIAALYFATQTYFGHSAPIVHEFKFATESNLTVSEIIALIARLQTAVAEKSGKGILIVIDELGKFLEYDARQPNSNDIFLLQAIAEFAKTGHKANVLLVVLMHQTIEQYAKILGETAKNEWLKISGRFESVPFLESAEQTMRVIAAAFRNTLTAVEKNAVQMQTDDIALVLADQSALPNHLNVQTASDLFAQCYPLHPLSLLILPVLCQKVAQNERTLFSYLGSQETHGFKDSLSRLNTVDEWILPWEIFDYFIQNQPTATTDHLTHRRWAEVVTALERLGHAAPIAEMELLKTIGLFNIIGHHNGLKSSCALLDLTNADKTSALDSLSKKSIINFQRFSGEYRVWEGSDFDLDAAMSEAIQLEGHFNLAEKLNQRKTQLPIVARKYSIQHGTLRYFQPIYIDKNSSNDVPIVPQIHFFLSENADDSAHFDTLIQNENPLVIYVLCQNAANYRAVIEEVCALERIQNENPLLKTDRVAQYEWRDAHAAAAHAEDELLNEFLTQPELHHWFWRGEKLQLLNKRDLQHHLSTVLEKIYYAAPIIKNELVNRHKPSSQGNAARNKLIAALLSQSDKADLGFEADKFPPEKSIYRALFKETGVHVEQNGVWRLVSPAENPYKFAPVWQGIDDFIAKNNSINKLVALYEYLNQPPFGIQQGVLPLIFAAYYFTNQRTIALYEDGIFCPHATLENFEVLLKRPELFSFEKVDINNGDIKGDLFNKYLEKLVGKVSDDAGLLEIIKPLARFIKGLPEYTLHTKELALDVLAVRDAFLQTQSPVKLLFEILPQACGFAELNDADMFLNKLVQHLKTLQNAYSALLKDFKQSLCDDFHLNKTLELPELRQHFRRYAGLEKYTRDSQGLLAFITRLQNNKDTDSAWLESIAAFLGKVPPTKWRNENKSEANYRLADLSEKLLNLEELHAHQCKFSADSDTKVTMIRLISEAEGEQNYPAFIDSQTESKARDLFDSLSDKFQSIDASTKYAFVMHLLKQR